MISKGSNSDLSYYFRMFDVTLLLFKIISFLQYRVSQ